MIKAKKKTGKRSSIAYLSMKAVMLFCKEMVMREMRARTECLTTAFVVFFFPPLASVVRSLRDAILIIFMMDVVRELSAWNNGRN